MISPEKLARQRLEVEHLRLKAERVEAEVRLVTARRQAAELGLVRLCACGRPIGKQNRTGICRACFNRTWMAARRAELRKVGG